MIGNIIINGATWRKVSSQSSDFGSAKINNPTKGLLDLVPGKRWIPKKHWKKIQETNDVVRTFIVLFPTSIAIFIFYGNGETNGRITQ